MTRVTFAHVDLDALADNARAVAASLRRRAEGSAAPAIIGVVKANAYGHGAVQVARTLERSGASMVACADIEEAVALREGGVTGPILVFGALSLSDLDGVFRHDLTPSISTPTAAREIQRAAERRGTRVRYHLKIDTGMNRLGFRFDNLDRTVPDVLNAPNLALEGIYTHFATSDETDAGLFEEQRRRFAGALGRLRRMGARPPMVHAANSAALLRDPACWHDAVRPGLLLYGACSGASKADVALRPVMGVQSRIVAVKGVRIGESVGYGARFVAARPTTLAVVPAGYADGLDTRMAGRAEVLVRGRRVPVVGSVCMDMITIDVTGLDVAPGDDVVIVGSQGSDAVTIGELAGRVGTIPYELLCRVGARIERVYNRSAL